MGCQKPWDDCRQRERFPDPVTGSNDSSLVFGNRLDDLDVAFVERIDALNKPNVVERPPHQLEI